MTRRKKTKSTADQSAAGVNAPATALPAAARASAAVVTRDNTAGALKNTTTLSPTTGHVVSANGRNKTHSGKNLPVNQAMFPSTTSSSTAASSNTRSTVASSSVSETASTSSLEPNETKTLNKRRPRKPIKTKVSYVTKQIHIYSMYPMLTVERLPNLEYHVAMLTDSIGRRPRVYQHGKGVRFVPESNDEYRTIQRYLAKIESAERIAWCSHTLLPGNSIKVNVKVRVVEVIKATDDLEKLKLHNSANLALANSKNDTHVNPSLPYKGNTPKEVRAPAKNSTSKESNLTVKESSPNGIKMPSINFSDKAAEPITKDSLPKDIKLSAKDFDLKHVKLNRSNTEPKDSNLVRPKDIILSTKDLDLKNVKLNRSNTNPKDSNLVRPKDIKLSTKVLEAKDVKLITPKTESKESKPVVSQKGGKIPDAKTERVEKIKKPRDIAQNRSYKKKNIY